jgi:hypothetical protein
MGQNSARDPRILITVYARAQSFFCWGRACDTGVRLFGLFLSCVWLLLVPLTLTFPYRPSLSSSCSFSLLPCFVCPCSHTSDLLALHLIHPSALSFPSWGGALMSSWLKAIQYQIYRVVVACMFYTCVCDSWGQAAALLLSSWLLMHGVCVVDWSFSTSSVFLEHLGVRARRKSLPAGENWQRRLSLRNSRGNRKLLYRAIQYHLNGCNLNSFATMS